jgi:dolichol kinase
MPSLNFWLISGLYLILFGGAESLKRWGHIPPTLTRKILHMASALVACILPMLISLPEIIGMGLLFAAVLAWSKSFKVLSSIHDVPRKTWGEVVFPLGIVLVAVYVYSAHAVGAGSHLWGPYNYLHDEGYFFGMLVMGFLDVGAEWGGRIPSPKWPGMHGKSLAGSATFFLLGLVLGWIFGLPFSWTFLFGLLLLSALEAYLAYGLDNLFLPLGGALLYYASTGSI